MLPLIADAHECIDMRDGSIVIAQLLEDDPPNARRYVIGYNMHQYPDRADQFFLYDLDMDRTSDHFWISAEGARALLDSLRVTPRECEWFAGCDNDATTTRSHPVLGPVPICERCQSKIESL